MHFIFRYQNPELIKYVIDMDINIDLSGGDGWRPIHYLCRYSTLEMVKYIMNKGVDIKSKIIKSNGELNEITWETVINENGNIDAEVKKELLSLIKRKIEIS